MKATGRRYVKNCRISKVHWLQYVTVEHEHDVTEVQAVCYNIAFDCHSLLLYINKLLVLNLAGVW